MFVMHIVVSDSIRNGGLNKVVGGVLSTEVITCLIEVALPHLSLAVIVLVIIRSHIIPEESMVIVTIGVGSQLSLNKEDTGGKDWLQLIVGVGSKLDGSNIGGILSRISIRHTLAFIFPQSSSIV